MSLGRFQNALVERYAAGALPSFLARVVERRVHEDEAWARRYHELRVMERALSSSSPSLSRSQLDALASRVLGGAAHAAHAPKSAGRPWLAFAGAVACAVVIVAVVARPAPKDDEFRERGSTSAKSGLHVRCVAANNALVSEVDVPLDGSRASLRCAKGALLALSATNTTSTPLAVALQLDGADAMDEPSTPPGAIDVPLPNGVRLDDAGAHHIEIRDGAHVTRLDVEVAP
jgi:hypothetical protein